MVYAMEQWSSSRRNIDEPEFNLREWSVKAKNISRENTNSRRFSVPNMRTSFRELETKSFRSNTTISSTASSPGYILTDEIDPSKYSFTTAIKALKARSGYGWEWLSPDGFVLNSKWNEAERYICNPFSGEIPMECLSARTLSRRSLQTNSTSKISVSTANPIYPSNVRLVRSKSIVTQDHETIDSHDSPLQEEKVETLGDSDNKSTTTDTTTNTSSDQSSSSSCGTSSSTPPTEERSIKRNEIEDREEEMSSDVKSKSNHDEIEENEKRSEKIEKRKKDKALWKWCSWQGRGCIPLRNLWMKSDRNKFTNGSRFCFGR